MEFELLTGQTIGMLVMDFALVFAVLLLVRVLYGVASGVDTLHEISVKDNFAIGISLAGATAAIGIMLTGVVSGEFAFSYRMEFFAIGSYGVLGLALMWLTRLIFDRVSLPRLSVRAEIGDGNVAVATVEPVVTQAAQQPVVVDAAVERVIAGSAIEQVAAAVAREDIVAVVAPEEVVAESAGEEVVAGSTQQPDVFAVAEEPVVACVAEQDVAARVAVDRVVPVAADDQVRAVVTVEHVGAVSAVEPVVTGPAGDDIIAILTEETIVARAKSTVNLLYNNFL